MFKHALFLVFLSFGTSVFAQGSEPHPQETAALQHAAAGQKAMEAKEFELAATEYGKAVELVPNAAEYHIGLINALKSASEFQKTWLALRRAARTAPGNNEIARLFTSFWNIFDHKGMFNVGEPIQKIAETLGKPDHGKSAPNRQRLVYGYYAIDGRNGKVHEILDLRGLKGEHFLADEFISADLDGRGWRCNYRVTNHLVTTAEYVLLNEQIQNWTELVNMQRIHGQAKRGVPLRQVVAGMMDSLEKSNPDRQFRILDEQPKSILFEWKTGGSEQSSAQHEIVRMLSGLNDIHRMAYVKKVPSLPEEERNRWISILKSAELKPVPSGESTTANASTGPTADQSTAKTRQLAWELGSKLSGAAIMHSQGADKKKTAVTLRLTEEAAAALGLSLAPLPETTDDKQQNTIDCIQYLIANTGRELHGQLTAKYDKSHAALLETAIKSHLLTLLYAPGDSTAAAFASAIKERAPIANLPSVLTAPLLSSIENEAERRNVVMLVLKMHTDVKLMLERTAKTASATK